MQSLTGDFYLDVSIASMLDDTSLNNFRLLNRYTHNLCSTDDFWQYKTYNTFYIDMLPEKPAKMSWKEWYNHWISTVYLNDLYPHSINLHIDDKSPPTITYKNYNLRLLDDFSCLFRTSSVFLMEDSTLKCLIRKNGVPNFELTITTDKTYYLISMKELSDIFSKGDFLKKYKKLLDALNYKREHIEIGGISICPEYVGFTLPTGVSSYYKSVDKDFRRCFIRLLIVWKPIFEKLSTIINDHSK